LIVARKLGESQSSENSLELFWAAGLVPFMVRVRGVGMSVRATPREIAYRDYAKELAQRWRRG
jgi:hypothetical protein